MKKQAGSVTVDLDNMTGTYVVRLYETETRYVEWTAHGYPGVEKTLALAQLLMQFSLPMRGEEK